MILIFCLSLIITTSQCFEKQINSRCPGPPDRGPCNRNIFKWAYDPQKNECFMFIWGGCAGNDRNRFDSELQCMKQCISVGPSK